MEVGARGGGLLGEMRVEPAALRHVRQRFGVSAVEAFAKPQGETRAVDRALDDRRQIDVRDSSGAKGDAAAAGFVAREALPVEQEHRGPALGE